MAAGSETQQKPGHRWSAAIVLICWLGIAIWANVRYAGPAAKPISVPDNEFSAQRALQIMERLIGNGKPHPAGSAEIKEVRARIVQYFAELGLPLEQQRGQASHPARDGEAIPLVNLETVIPGSKPNDRVILLLAHYDSSPRGNGAADDGVGVATILEIVRMIQENRDEFEPRNTIRILITDGEEFGLLGAKMYVDQQRHQDVAAVINLEARGTSGASLMFETQTGNRKVIPIFAAAASQPICSSLFFEVYKYLPNDTDFTVFKQAGVAGWNFAFIGDVKNYHTENDVISNVDRRSIQHHGDNMWALLQAVDRELAEASGADPLAAQENDNVVYFDVLGYFVAWWPVAWSLPLILLAAILGGLMFRLTASATESSNRQTDADVAASAGRESTSWWMRILRQPLFAGWNFGLGVAVVAGLGCTSTHFALVYSEGIAASWEDDAAFSIAGIWLMGLCVLATMAWLFDRRAMARPLLGLMFFLWLVFAALCAIWLPGATYLFLAPSLAFTVVGWLVLLARKSGLPARHVLPALLIAFPLCAGFFWIPAEGLFYDAIGFKYNNQPLIFRIVLVGTTWLPTMLSTRDQWVPYYSCGLATLGFLCCLAAVVG